MHKICLKMDFDSRQFVLHYFCVATVHLGMPMGQFFGSDFYNIDRSAESLTRTVYKNFIELPCKAEERASRACIRDAWTIVYNIISSSIWSHGRGNSINPVVSLERIQNHGKHWALLCVREMAFWASEKLIGRIQRSCTASFEMQFCDVIFPLSENSFRRNGWGAEDSLQSHD